MGNTDDSAARSWRLQVVVTQQKTRQELHTVKILSLQPLLSSQSSFISFYLYCSSSISGGSSCWIASGNDSNTNSSNNNRIRFISMRTALKTFSRYLIWLIIRLFIFFLSTIAGKFIRWSSTRLSFMNVITVNYVNLDLTNRFAYTCKNKNRFQFSWRFKEHQRELGLFWARQTN